MAAATTRRRGACLARGFMGLVPMRVATVWRATAQLAYTAAAAQSSAGGRVLARTVCVAGCGATAPRRAPRTLYAAVVEQARQPVFYADWGVPDSREGRLEMVSLHAILVMRRLRERGPRRAARWPRRCST